MSVRWSEMGRVYEKLECGCYVSEDSGGGLIPCSYEEENPDCKFQEYMKGVERNGNN